MIKHFGLEPDKDVKFATGGLPEGRLAPFAAGVNRRDGRPGPPRSPGTEAKVSREVALSDVADLSILREAQKELGIKGN
jgi:hypothetical protein